LFLNALKDCTFEGKPKLFGDCPKASEKFEAREVLPYALH